MRRALAAFAVAVTALVGFASPAFAHAQVTSTDPAAGADLPSTPTSATVTFDEAVQARADGLQLHDSTGRRVDNGGLQRLDGGRSLRLPLSGLPDGGYVLTWRVVSADGHPVSGGVTWRVGKGGAVDQTELQQLLNARGGDSTLHAVAAGVRALLFAALVVLIGGLLFVLLVWPDGADDRRVHTLLRGSTIVAMVTTVLSMGLEGADIAGLGLSHAVSVSKALDTLDASFGKAAVARLVLLALLGWLALTMTGARRRSMAWGASVGIVSTLTLATLSYAGHARTGRWTSIAVPLDVVHLFAAATWLGGLVLLSLLVLRGGGPDSDRIVGRFSTVAAVCVGALVATGTVQSWRQLGHLSALRETDYGRLLVIKLGLVAVVIIAGAMSRSLVRARTRALVPAGDVEGADDEEEIDLVEVHRRLRVSVGLETVVAIAVLVVTSLLVAANPSQAAANQDFNASKVVQGTVIQVDVPSTRSGPMTFHLYASDPSAGLTTAYEATATLSLPGRNIEGVTVPLQVTGHAHWTAEGVDVPIRGTWKLEITITIGDLTSRTVTFDIPVT